MRESESLAFLALTIDMNWSVCHSTVHPAAPRRGGDPPPPRTPPPRHTDVGPLKPDTAPWDTHLFLFEFARFALYHVTARAHRATVRSTPGVAAHTTAEADTFATVRTWMSSSLALANRTAGLR